MRNALSVSWMLLPFGMVGVALFALLGWPVAVGGVGLMLWLDDLIPDAPTDEPKRRGKGG